MQEVPLGCAEGAGSGGDPAVVQHQDEAGVIVAQEVDLHIHRFSQHLGHGVVSIRVEGGEGLSLCRETGGWRRGTGGWRRLDSCQGCTRGKHEQDLG